MLSCRARERQGTARVSTAYQFYEAVKDTVVLKRRSYAAREKPPFEATGYELFYYAAHEADERGKTDVMVTLNRKQDMWDCTELKGSSERYEFVGMPLSSSGAYTISMRILPCPCVCCSIGDYHLCINEEIVGEMQSDTMKFKEAPDCPDRLSLPLEKYTNDILKEFHKMYDLI